MPVSTATVPAGGPQQDRGYREGRLVPACSKRRDGGGGWVWGGGGRWGGEAVGEGVAGGEGRPGQNAWKNLSTLTNHGPPKCIPMRPRS